MADSLQRALILAAAATLLGCTGGSPHSRAWPVMGTTFAIRTWDRPSESAQKAIETAWEEVLAVDRAMSGYRSESEVSRLNRAAGTNTWTELESSTRRVIDAAEEVRASSSGLFNPMMGPLVRLWRMNEPLFGEKIHPPSKASISRAKELSHPELLEWRPDRAAARLHREGAEVDLGGIAKGYALDRAAWKLEEGGIRSALLDLGGQLRFVGKDPSGGDWTFGVYDPANPEKLIATGRVPSGSIATSGTYERYFEWEGRRYGHVLDPRTGWPVRSDVAVTVWAPTAMEADAWSTAYLVAEPEQGDRWLDARPRHGLIRFERGLFNISGSLRGRVETGKISGRQGLRKR